MKAFILSTAAAAAAALAIIPASSANAAVQTFGGPLAQVCYNQAVAGDPRSFAIDGCTRAIEEEGLLAPDKAATYVNRGIIYMSAGRFTLADADFDSALKLNRNLADGWLNKGFLRLRQGNGREALPLIQKGIDAGAGDRALAIFARGVAHEQMGDLQSAYADLSRARDLQPGWSLPRKYLANYHLRQ